MASLTQDNIKDIGGVVADSIQRIVPGIVRKETDDIRNTLGVHNNTLGSLGMMLKALQIDVRQLNQSVRRLDVLYEDLNDRFKADSEVLKSNYTVKDQVDNHTERIKLLESGQTMLKIVVKEHSLQLKPKAG